MRPFLKNALFAALTLLMVVAACQSVPVTGRKQLLLIPNSQMLSLSESQYDDVLSKAKLSKDQEKVAMVRRVGSRIQKAVERYMAQRGNSARLDGFEWEFNLIEENTVNAWCMPGGKVAFYTGILPVCENEEGIAVVMGHEVAHAVADHGNERMSKAMLASGIGIGLAVALKEKPAATQALFLSAYGVGAGVTMLAFSRQQESEADEMGLEFMALAGYDPREAPRFWERMSSMSGGKAPPEFFSTHPSHDTRIADLNELLPKAIQTYEANKR